MRKGIGSLGDLKVGYSPPAEAEMMSQKSSHIPEQDKATLGVTSAMASDLRAMAATLLSSILGSFAAFLSGQLGAEVDRAWPLLLHC